MHSHPHHTPSFEHLASEAPVEDGTVAQPRCAGKTTVEQAVRLRGLETPLVKIIDEALPIDEDMKTIETGPTSDLQQNLEEAMMPEELRVQLNQLNQLMSRLSPAQQKRVLQQVKHRNDNTHDVFGHRIYVKKRTSKTRKKK